MSLFEKLKEAGKKAAKQLEEEARKRYEEHQLQQEKRKLLHDLNKRDLINFCFQNDIPASTKMDKEELINGIISDEDVSLEDIKEYCNRILMEGIKTTRISHTEDMEVEQEIIRTEKIKTRVRKRKTSRVLSKLRTHVNKFNPIPRKNIRERQIEAEMVQTLRAHLGEDKVNYQERARSGRLDIVVDGKYAIELKVLNAPSQLNTVIGQLIKYSKEYDKIFLWVYNRRKSIRKSHINDFQKLLKSANVKNVDIIVKH